MSRASVDLAIIPILAELQTKQDAAFVKNGKYAQLYATHDGVPTEATDIKASLVKDEDITPTLPLQLDFVFRVDEIRYSDTEFGWILWVWVKEDDVTYVKTWATHDEGYPEEWTLTNTGPVD